MAKRNVVWTRTADIQYDGILAYWIKRNGSSVFSKKLVELVSERTQQIAQNPLLYKRTDLNDTRVASLGNFSIYYKFNDTEKL